MNTPKSFLVFLVFSCAMSNIWALDCPNCVLWDGGGGNTDWFTAANWSGNAVPSATDSVKLDHSSIGTAFEVVVDQVETIKYLEIDAANITLTVEEAITVTHGVDNAGVIVVEETADFIQSTGSTLANSGTMTHYKTGSSDTQIYNYWSSPITSGTISKYTASPLGNLTGTYVYSYTNGISDQSGWNAIAAQTSMTVGRGYALTNGASATFSGTFNNGDITYSGTTDESPSWHLLGNPYPSSINAALWVTANVLDLEVAAIHLFDQCNDWEDFDSAEEYIAVNAIGSTSSCPSFIGGLLTLSDIDIASGQGFFVEKENPEILGDGDFEFTNAMRNAENSVLKANGAKGNSEEKAYPDPEVVANAPKINVTIESSGGLQKTCLLGFVEGATKEKDFWYDVSVDIGSTLGIFMEDRNGNHLSIQGLPELRERMVQIPLVVTADQPGYYNLGIGANNVEEAGYDVFLLDVEENEVIRGSEEVFIANSGVISGRFFLFVKEHFATGIEETDTEDALFISYNSGVVAVANAVQSVELLDPSGRTLQQLDLNRGDAFQTAQISLNSGMYILRGVSPLGTITERIYLMR